MNYSWVYMIGHWWIYQTKWHSLPSPKKQYIGFLVKKRINVYSQLIWQSQYQQITVDEHVCFCSNEEFQMFPFTQIKQENKLLRKMYEYHYIDHFKPLSPKVVSYETNQGSHVTSFLVYSFSRQSQIWQMQYQ